MDKSRTTVDGWVKDLGQTVGVDISLDQEGICAIGHEEQLTSVIEVPENSTAVFLYTSVANLTGSNELDFPILSRAMELNLYQIATRGGSLGFSSELNQILFCLNIDIEGCDSSKFSNIFHNFVETSLLLRNEFNLTDAKESKDNNIGSGGMHV